MSPKAATPERIDLPIEGMTLRLVREPDRARRSTSSRASRRRVNYATEQATRPTSTRRGRRPASSSARSRRPATRALPAADGAPRPPSRTPTGALRRLLVAAALSLPVLLLAMIPALQFDYWQWLALALATPVVLWAGWPFHRAAWQNLRHGAATMDTLISLGTLAAWGWSVVALFFLDAGRAGHAHAVRAGLSRTAASDTIYLEVASVVTT